MNCQDCCKRKTCRRILNLGDGVLACCLGDEWAMYSCNDCEHAEFCEILTQLNNGKGTDQDKAVIITWEVP